MIPYPRIGIVRGADSTGAPLLLNGVVNQATIDEYAKWSVVELETGLLSRTDIIDALRKANPNIKVLARVNLRWIFAAEEQVDPDNDLSLALFDSISNVPNVGSPGRCAGFLWSACYTGARGFPFGPDWFNPLLTCGTVSGGVCLNAGNRPVGGTYSLFNVNFARPEVPDIYIYHIIDKVIKGNRFDGIRFDYADHTILWATGSPTLGRFTLFNGNPPDTWGGDWNLDVIDGFRAGGFSQDTAGATAFDAAYAAGHLKIMRELRAAAPSDFLMILNNGGYGQVSENPYINGTMRENFTANSRTEWDKDIIIDPAGSVPGMLSNDFLYAAPQANMINKLPSFNLGNGEWDASGNLQNNRFGLGSTTLGDGIFCLCENSTPPEDSPFNKFFPEYSVDVDSGLATMDGSRVGWLGEPVTRAYEVGTIKDCWRRDFRFGSVVVNPNGSSKTIQLDETLRRITSNVPGDTVNIGGDVTQVTVQAFDAIFLIRPTPFLRAKPHS